ncbi:thymidylate kinase [Streptomyces fradiae]|uniref:dTMP kinase n=1 Tax=Streptomyces fradiae TaxID=1906 RepID=UPI002942FC24|nr:thymidylate kinase [Streptomyces fradiae]WOI59626.1 thymidylate kinase [Streptomyces fradiae]
MITPPHPYQPLHHEGGRQPFIVLEGVSGIGKSTLSKALASRLRAFTLHTLPHPHDAWSRTVNGWLRPLPQFAFYLSGALHASDRIRERRATAPVVADRYISSIVACHAAVHRVPIQAVRGLITPFQPYLVAPDLTFYLRCSEASLRERLVMKTDLKQDDTDLLAVPDRLTRLIANFDHVAQLDPSAITLDTDGRSPDELVDAVLRQLAERCS